MKKVTNVTVLLFILVLASQCKKNQNHSERCLLKPDAGDCEAAIPKYYYSAEEGTCKEFLWGGCGGVVPFDTKEACQKACGCVN